MHFGLDGWGLVATTVFGILGLGLGIWAIFLALRSRRRKKQTPGATQEIAESPGAVATQGNHNTTQANHQIVNVGPGQQESKCFCGRICASVRLLHNQGYPTAVLCSQFAGDTGACRLPQGGQCWIGEQMPKFRKPAVLRPPAPQIVPRRSSWVHGWRR